MAILECGVDHDDAGIFRRCSGDIRVTHGRKSGQVLENLRSKVVIDGAAFLASFMTRSCVRRTMLATAAEIISLVCRLRWFRTVVRWLVKTASVGDGVRNGEPEAPGGLINTRTSFFITHRSFDAVDYFSRV